MNITDRAGFIAGLHAVADFLYEHPEVPLPYLGSYIDGSLSAVLPIYLVGGDQKAQLATIARAMGNASKAPVTYGNGDERFQVWREFCGVVLMAQASRDQVCTRVVTGTEDREVTEVVTPEVTRKAVKTFDVVEWKCEPLLSPGHPFTRPGQVAADCPAPDQCMECGEPEAAHTLPATVLTETALERDPDGVAAPVVAALHLSHDMPSCRTCGAQDVPLEDGQCQEHTKAGAR